MLSIKLGRESYKPKRDNLVDLMGYAEILQALRGENVIWSHDCKLRKSFRRSRNWERNTQKEIAEKDEYIKYLEDKLGIEEAREKWLM